MKWAGLPPLEAVREQDTAGEGRLRGEGQLGVWGQQHFCSVGQQQQHMPGHSRDQPGTEATSHLQFKITPACDAGVVSSAWTSLAVPCLWKCLGRQPGSFLCLGWTRIIAQIQPRRPAHKHHTVLLSEAFRVTATCPQLQPHSGRITPLPTAQMCPSYT